MTTAVVVAAKWVALKVFEVAIAAGVNAGTAVQIMTVAKVAAEVAITAAIIAVAVLLVGGIVAVTLVVRRGDDTEEAAVPTMFTSVPPTTATPHLQQPPKYILPNGPGVW